MNRVWIDYANFRAQNGYKKALLVLAFLLFLKTASAHSWLSRVAQFWEHSPFINVQIPASASYFGWVCCWFSPLLPFSSEYYYCSPQKPTFQNSNSTRNGRRRTTFCISHLLNVIHYLLLLWRPSFLLAVMAGVAWQQNKKSRRHAK